MRHPVPFSLAALLVLLPGAGASERPGAGPAKSPNEPAVVRELEELRTPTARHFLLDDGLIRAEITGAPTSFRRADGSWEAIAPRLEATAGGWATEGSAVAAQVSGDGTIRWADFAGVRRGDWVTASPLAGPLAAPDGEWRATGPARLERCGGAGPCERFEPTPAGFLRSLVLTAPPAPGTPVVVETLLSLPAGWQVVRPADARPGRPGPQLPVVVDADGRVRHEFLPPMAVEDSGEPDRAGSTSVGRFDLDSPAPGVARLRASFEGAWFADPARRWPVVVDPSVSVTGNWGGYIYDHSSVGWMIGAEQNPCAIVRLSAWWNASGPTAGYMRFDTSSIPPTARVTSATLAPWLVSAGSSALVLAYDAGRRAPYGGATPAELAVVHADLRGGALGAAWWVTSGSSGLQATSGNANLAENVQVQLPEGNLTVGFVSDGAGGTDSTVRVLDSGQTQLAVVYAAAPVADVAITEVFRGNPDWVEVYNYGADVVLDGSKLASYDGTVATYTVGAGVTLKRHAFLRFIEGTGTDTATEIFTGGSWGWVSSSSGVVSLRTAADAGVDTVRFGTPPASAADTDQHWPGDGVAGTGDAIRRVRDGDSDQAVDWAVGASSTPGAFNPGLLGSRRRGTLVVNEVNTGGADGLEIANHLPVAQSLAGWRLETYTDDTLDGTGYDFPASATIPPFGILRVTESGSPSNDTPFELFTGYNVSWDSGSSGQATLFRTTGLAGGDFVAWNDPQDFQLRVGQQWNGAIVDPAGSTWFRRVDHLDSDSTWDWAGDAAGSPGQANPTQVATDLSWTAEVGGPETAWTTTGYSYGNRFAALQDAILVGFRQEVVLNAAQDAKLFVLEKVSTTWNSVLERSFTALPQGGHLLSTGVANVPLVAGRSYALVLWTAGNATFREEYESGGCPEYVPFGTFSGWIYQAGLPTAPLEQTTAYAAHQWIETTSVGSLDPLVVATASLPDGTNGVAYSVPLAAAGGAGGYAWSLASGALPSGLSLAPSGLLAGTPSGSGSSTFTVRVTDAFGQTATKAFTVYVVGPSAVRLATSYLPDGRVAQLYPDVQLVAEGGTPPYTFTRRAGTIPPGLSLATSGMLSGTPTTEGVFNVTFRVTDSAARTNDRAYVVTIGPKGVPDVWVRRGLNGGELKQLAVSPHWATDGTAFTANLGDRLWATRDRGRTWTATRLGLFATSGVWRALAVSPTYDDAAPNGIARTVLGVYADAGGGGSDRLVRSTDGGATWVSYTLGSTISIESLLVSPDYAADGRLAAFGHSGNLFVSTNRGNSWTERTAFPVFDAAFSPHFAVDRKLFAVSANSPWTTLYESTDLGATWVARASVGPISRIALSPSFASDRTLFVWWEDLWKSTDGGASFSKVWDHPTDIPHEVIVPPGYDENGPTTRQLFAILTVGDTKALLHRSDDGGRTFTRISTSLPDEGGSIEYMGLGTWAPADTTTAPIVPSPAFVTDRTLLHAGRSFWVSEDAGVRWEQRSNGLKALRFQKIAWSPNFPTDGTLFALTDAGGLYKSANRGLTLTRIPIPHAADSSRLELELFDIALSNAYNDLTGTPGDVAGATMTLFVSGGGGVYRSRDGGFSWTALAIDPTNHTDYMMPWVRLSPTFATDKDMLALNRSSFWRSLDGGDTWSVVPTDASSCYGPKGEDATFSPNYASDGTVFATFQCIGAPDDLATHRITTFAGTPHWTTLLDGGMPVGGRVQTGNGYLNGSATARRRIFWVGAHKTTDNGSTWTTVEPGTLSTAFYTDDTLLRTTEGPPVAVRRSTDGGATESPLSSDADLNAVPLAGAVGEGSLLEPAYGPYLARNYTAASGVLGYALQGYLALSSDGGATWAPVDGEMSISTDIRGVDTDKTNSNIVYVATGDQGLFKSLDRGLTFHRLQKGLPTANLTWEAIRVLGPAQTTIVAGHSASGIYRSTNSGLLWSAVAGTAGRVTSFIEGGGFVFASRADGRSYRSSDLGATWTLLDATRTDLVDLSYRGSVISPLAAPKGGPARAAGSPGDPLGIKALVWGMTSSHGPAASFTNGSSFVVMDGSDGPFPIPLDLPWNCVLAWSGSDDEVLAGSQGNGVWKTWDGGDTWHPMTRGLAGTSANVAELYEAPNADILAGIVGTTDGGVYLSADGGVHWVVINEGFDPDDLSVQDLVNDSATDGTLSYWAGKTDDGIWTRTIDVLPDPEITNLSVVTGPATGGTATVVTGLNFQVGAVVEFDGLPAPTVRVSSTTLNVTTPRHWAGAAVVKVVNPDTRDGTAAQAFTFTEGAGALLLTVTKSGASDVRLSWVDPPPPNGSYDVYWSVDPTFDGWVEAAASGLVVPQWIHAGVQGNGFVYYYKVE